MKSIIAGIFIGIAAITNLKVGGGVLGAFLFSVGLIAVLRFEAELFTGKAGLLATREIGVWKILEIWIGNLLGTALPIALILFTPNSADLSQAAIQIVEIRISNGFAANLILGIFCGILMTIAVRTFVREQPLYAILPVMVFILAGFNHCVADMAYCHLANYGYETLIPTTVGNIIGCCLPFLLQRIQE